MRKGHITLHKKSISRTTYTLSKSKLKPLKKESQNIEQSEEKSYSIWYALGIAIISELLYHFILK